MYFFDSGKKLICDPSKGTLMEIAKSIDPGQPAQSEHGRNF